MVHQRARQLAWRRRWRHSLRLRLVTLFLILALAMAAAFVMGMRGVFASGWRDVGIPLVGDYVSRLAAEVGDPPSIERARALSERLPISVRITGPRINWDSHPEPIGMDDGWERNKRDLLTRTTSDGHRIRFGLGPMPWERGPGRVVWLTLGMLLLFELAAYAIVRRLLRPLDDIGAGAERFGRGQFDEPIPIRRNDELGDLGERINTMARDIHAMLDAKRGLLLALSHELRSPLTRARLNAELLPANAEGEAERAALLRDLNLMRDLISDLLESERLSSPHAALVREPLDMAAVVREAVAGLPQGDTVRLRLAIDLPAVSVDRTRMRLLLRNMIDNALRHGGLAAGAAQPPEVTLRRVSPSAGDPGQDMLEIEVRDYGPGVEEAQIARLAEPFYRSDAARARATGGVGLGMYLCSLVAQAHGGSFTLRNAHPGLSVVVRLSLAQPAGMPSAPTMRVGFPPANVKRQETPT
ncbi:HAMP domain-containing sensor histidine kinase [Variovorax dokdonensis]|uniref:histidine kinase n=1 Tax=Variovorax dokdonensis TaxID=344883 RepID=A0ABT7NG33_9BURK|nr:HAMP domain-containing sensor histidine kinase [Variovorax dokdonensis]MDM0046887.1 HAMP domain-containing sensor histidine kinase [Variovorax dokdonensis]